MSDFKAAPNSISAGAPPQAPLGELSAFPRTSMNLRDLILREEKWKCGRRRGKGREGNERGGKRRGPQRLVHITQMSEILKIP